MLYDNFLWNLAKLTLLRSPTRTCSELASGNTLPQLLFLETESTCMAAIRSFVAEKAHFENNQGNYSSFPWFRWHKARRKASTRVCLNSFCFRVSMSSLSSSTSRPNYTSTFPAPASTEITPVPADERIFFQTAAARGISGVFVWLSLIITGHQVRNRTSFGFTW